jgi:hypothetical protein
VFNLNNETSGGGGQVLAMDGWSTGLAGHPGYSFINDPTMGMYRATANNLSFALTGTQELELTSVHTWVKSGVFDIGGTAGSPTLRWLDANGTQRFKLQSSAPSSPAEGWLYANSTDHTLRYYNGTSFIDLTLGGAGGGTVTNFSAGDLSPLFTTTEANTTTTPALSFVLSTAAANTVFGNNTGSTAAPGFQTLVDAQIPDILTLTRASNLTTNGIVNVSGGNGTLGSGNLTGDVTTSGGMATSISAGAVTLGDMASIATDSILGRATTGTGAPEVLTALPFAATGDVTRPADSNVNTIVNDVVTYAKMQNVSATNRFLGRITTGAGDPEELTGTQATTILDTFTSGLKGLAPSSGGGSTNFLRADGTWAAPPGGGTNPWGGSMTGRGDSTYTILNTDRIVYTNAAISTLRVWTLPAASTVSAGTAIMVIDSFGGITNAAIQIKPNGTIPDVIVQNNGGASPAPYVLSSQYSGVTLVSDGVSKWYATSAQPGYSSDGKFTQLKNGAWMTSFYALPATVGASGTIAISNGSDIVFSTAKYPLTAGASGNVLTSTGTDIISSPPVFPWGGSIDFHGNSNYNPIPASSKIVALNASITGSSISWTLPTAAAMGTGNCISIADFVGGITAGHKLLVLGQASDTISGPIGASFDLTVSYQGVTLISDGVSKWYPISWSGGNSSAGAFMQTSPTTGVWGASPYGLPQIIGADDTVLESDGSAVVFAATVGTGAVVRNTAPGIVDGYFFQAANGGNNIEGRRFVDSGTTGNFIVFRNQTDGTNILQFDTTGTMQAGTIPAARISGGGGAPAAATYITQTADGSLSNEQVLGSLATGILKNTTSTGVLSIAVAGDFPTLNQSTTGSAATLTTSRNLWGQSFNGSAAIGGAIELGTAGTTDTTLDRSSAGVAQVEGVAIPTISSTNTLTNKRITKRVLDTNAPSSPVTPDSDAYDGISYRGINAALTLNAPSGTPTAMQALLIRLKDDGTGRGLTWTTGSNGFRAIGAAFPTTTVANKTTYVLTVWNVIDSRWDSLAVATEP